MTVTTAKISDFNIYLKKKLISKKKDPYEAVPFSKMSREEIQGTMKARRDERD